VNQNAIINEHISFDLKLATNGVLLDRDFISVFEAIASLPFVNMKINISIDGGEQAQLSNRPARF
jgi:sulfatase maturation enzyme AslB (radical SAM superfamily)